MIYLTRILQLNGKKKNLHSRLFSFSSSCLLRARHLPHLVTQEVRGIYYYSLKNKGISNAKS